MYNNNNLLKINVALYTKEIQKNKENIFLYTHTHECYNNLINSVILI